MADEPDKIGTGENGAGEDGSVTAASVEPASKPSMETETIGQAEVSGPDSEGRTRHSRWNRRMALIGVVAVLLGAALVLPPLINIGRYHHQIAAAMARSLGRPVRISGVELRLLPRPGFVLHDLAVSEDPAFGAEPILSARTVTASVRLLSLWRGRLEVDRISVDEASLNIVRTPQGRWNLDALLMGSQPGAANDAAAESGGLIQRTSSAHFPYLEATDSQVNLKNGVEKSPFSLLHTDLSLWQDDPGQWRVRLRGQPVRTDMEIVAADTGEVRLEASLRSAGQLREMPLQLQIEWREGQLGQLSRLIFGSDAGWRGDLTADIAVSGTLDSAQTKARVRATGVRREEFAPDTPLDFDANCNFRYLHSQNALHDVGCDTAIGSGRLHLKAELPGNGGSPEATLEVSQVPVQAGLDLFRTVRSGFAPDISARGTVNGSLVYHHAPAELGNGQKTQGHAPVRSTSHSAGKKATEVVSMPENLTGTLTVEGGQLRGGELKEPLVLPRITLAPAVLAGAGRTGLGTRFAVALGLAPGQPAATNATATAAPSAQTTRQPGSPAAAEPGQVTGPGAAVASTTMATTAAQVLNVHLGLGVTGYEAAVNGNAEMGRMRDLAYAFGLPHSDALDGLSGPAARIDLAAHGSWIEPEAGTELETQANPATVAITAGNAMPRAAAPAAGKPLGTGKTVSAKTGSTKTVSAQSSLAAGAPAGQEAIAGTLTMHNALWKVAYLARPVRLTQAVMTIAPTQMTLASNFSYGAEEAAAKEPAAANAKNAAAKEVAGKGAGGKDSAGQTVPDSNTEGVEENGRDFAKAAGPGSAGSGSVGSGNAGSGSAASATIDGAVQVIAPLNCGALGASLPGTGAGCEPQVQLRLGAMNAAAVEAALAGPPQEKGIFAPLIDRMRSPNRPKWPEATVSVQADSLLLGPATLQKPVIRLHLKATQIDVESWEAELLGGSAKGTGSFAWTDDKPQYSLEGSFSRVNAAPVGGLVNALWSGGPVSGAGSVQLSGLTAKDLAASASGAVHFDWLHGVLIAGNAPVGPAPAGPVQDSPAKDGAAGNADAQAAPEARRGVETKFDDWSGDLSITGGKALIGRNTLLAGKRSSSLEGTITLGSPAKVSIASVVAKPAASAGKVAALPAAK